MPQPLLTRALDVERGPDCLFVRLKSGLRSA